MGSESLNIPIWGALLSIITTLAGGTALGVWLRYKLGSRKLAVEAQAGARQQDRLDFEQLLAVVVGQRDDERNLNGKLEGKVERLELEIIGLRLRPDLDPFPNWIIDLEGRYIFVNREFERQFLEPQGKNYRDMIGKRHEDIWPSDFCRKLRALDEIARNTPSGHSRGVTAIDGRKITVHKFPYRIRGAVVAYAGYITDVEEEVGP
jgi:PAS domain S-box-containing protein